MANSDYLHRRKIALQHIDKKLVRRLRIFFIITAIMLVFVFYDVFSGQIKPLLAIGGFLLGIIIGLLTGRMFNIHWKSEAEHVAAKLDAIGIVLLVLYVLIAMARNWLFSHWLQGPQLSIFGFVVVIGSLIGRLIVMVVQVRKVLHIQKIF